MKLDYKIQRKVNCKKSNKTKFNYLNHGAAGLHADESKWNSLELKRTTHLYKMKAMHLPLSTYSFIDWLMINGSCFIMEPTRGVVLITIAL